jgi:hypothetical protein
MARNNIVIENIQYTNSCRETLYSVVSRNEYPDAKTKIILFHKSFTYPIKKNITFNGYIALYSTPTKQRINEGLCKYIKEDIEKCFPGIETTVEFKDRVYYATCGNAKEILSKAYYSSTILAILRAAQKFNQMATKNANPNLYLYTNEYAGDCVKHLQEHMKTHSLDEIKDILLYNYGYMGLRALTDKMARKQMIPSIGHFDYNHYSSGAIRFSLPNNNETRKIISNKLAEIAEHIGLSISTNNQWEPAIRYDTIADVFGKEENPYFFMQILSFILKNTILYCSTNLQQRRLPKDVENAFCIIQNKIADTIKDLP